MKISRITQLNRVLVAQACSSMVDTVEELRPTGIDWDLRSDDPLRPFSLKHARQQASIVAHMQRAGLASPRSLSSDSLPAANQTSTADGNADRSSVVVPQQESVTSAANGVISEGVGLSDSCQTVKPVSEPVANGTVPAVSDVIAADKGDQTVYVEFGAGTGYLSAHLAECTSARQLVLLDRGSFRMKADRCSLTA